jgi:AraC-like DNA-binding protein
MNAPKDLIDVVAKSKLLHDFQQAFTEATGLPVGFQSAESWQLPLHGQKNESRFCALMGGQSRSCAHCLQMREKLQEGAAGKPCTMECGAGMAETAIPVRTGDHVIGFLHTGQVFRTAPAAAQFDRAAKLAGKLGLEADVSELHEAYFSTRVMSPERYEASVHLVQTFAEQLSMHAAQILEHERLAEPPVITRAKQYIGAHYEDDLSLEEVAKACHTSTFYFCKLFKRETGINFTEYLSSVRIAKAKDLLANRDLPVSQIAYQIGFQSLTHFNRVFKKTVGTAPTQFRDKLPVRLTPNDIGQPSALHRSEPAAASEPASDTHPIPYQRWSGEAAKSSPSGQLAAA